MTGARGNHRCGHPWCLSETDAWTLSPALRAAFERDLCPVCQKEADEDSRSDQEVVNGFLNSLPETP